MDPQAPLSPNQPNQANPPQPQQPVPLPPAVTPRPVVPGGAQTQPDAAANAFTAHGGATAPHIDPAEYEFIMNPPKPARGITFSSENKGDRLKLIAIGGVSILIVALILAKLFSHPNPLIAAMMPVAQEQQELLHLTTSTVAPAAQLSANQANFVATTTVVMTSSSIQLNTYLAENKIKLNPKLLSGKIDPTVDEQLTSAISSGVFQSTYDKVMTDALQNYASALTAAQKEVTGPNGRAYLSNQLNQAQLLYKQLSQPVVQTPATS
jgi:hypothetical protein